jgi:hypothetical protein
MKSQLQALSAAQVVRTLPTLVVSIPQPEIASAAATAGSDRRRAPGVSSMPSLHTRSASRRDLQPADRRAPPDPKLRAAGAAA